MTHFTCIECNRSFTAVSREEAEDAYKSQANNSKAASFDDALDTGEVAYARFCPYCGSAAIEVS